MEAATSGIDKMLNQVRVREEHFYFCLLRRTDHNSWIDGNKMNVHLFGKNDSPCSVNFAMKHIASNQKDRAYCLINTWKYEWCH